MSWSLPNDAAAGTAITTSNGGTTPIKQPGRDEDPLAFARRLLLQSPSEADQSLHQFPSRASRITPVLGHGNDYFQQYATYVNSAESNPVSPFLKASPSPFTKSPRNNWQQRSNTISGSSHAREASDASVATTMESDHSHGAGGSSKDSARLHKALDMAYSLSADGRPANNHRHSFIGERSVCTILRLY